MIARARKDGKAEFLMDLNEVRVFESMLMYFSLCIPNPVTREFANEMRMDMGGIMTLQVELSNPEAAKKARDRWNDKVHKAMAAQKRIEAENAEAAKRAEANKPPEIMNTTLGDKLKVALGTPVAGK